MADIFDQLHKFEGIEKTFNFAIEVEKVATELNHTIGDTCNVIELKANLF
tara:strand:- start:403 stop:552 length:150 start_codon:yes stop_codon:yes gene_type:complete